MISKGSDCEFCCEMHEPRSSRFRITYGEELPSRVIARSKNFIIMPTIGQIVPGSLLILPTTHVERAADLSHDELLELEIIIDELETHLDKDAESLVFEHGAKEAGGGGCGIYHAHFHLMPLPRGSRISAPSLLRSERFSGSLTSALESLKSFDTYLISRGWDKVISFVADDDMNRDMRSSQYLRRTVGDRLGLSSEWDWRKYSSVEPWLIDSVQRFSRYEFSFENRD
jgi:diadenosine tetraphosphate (Ap4A) HIT family hydrolase